ncbi:O-antigen polymerase [Planococcus halotolerans]|uniref:O-antigen polymerase n=1 Tax=Planococcus halotolerans TaxID=2233542 RepID=UPI0010932C44|nr:O-antigen polymerase [Planococcus halotolerans]QHJ70551.1 O-antigen polysaccharide polymerase Wzy [Planococcus halotolerans]
MLTLYLLLNTGFFILSIKLYGNKINPISIYSLIWLSALTLHQSGLINFDKLSLKTWIVIIGIQLIYVLGCYIGRKIIPYTNKEKFVETTSKNDEKRLKMVIIFVALISAIAIITNISMFISIYGFNLIKYTNQIYASRLNGANNIDTIPYLSSFVFIALIFSGIYIKKYGVKLFLLFPVLLLLANQLTTGGRSDIIFGVLLLSGPILFKNNNKLMKKKQKRFSKIKIVGIGSLFLSLFFIISKNRAAGQAVSSIYASDFLIQISGGDATLYKIIIYIAGPIGVLNAYLVSPVYDFGGNTFLTIFNLLNKIGYNLDVNSYQDFYNVPMAINVGTYIRELIQDFTIAGAILIVLLLGITFSSTYLETLVKSTYVPQVIASTIFTIIAMSFFDWKVRSAIFWIILVVGILLAVFLDKKIRIKK